MIFLKSILHLQVSARFSFKKTLGQTIFFTVTGYSHLNTRLETYIQIFPYLHKRKKYILPGQVSRWLLSVCKHLRCSVIICVLMIPQSCQHVLNYLKSFQMILYRKIYTVIKILMYILL